MAEETIYGRIIKGIAGFYYVDTKEYGIVECHAKGIFRKNQMKPLVGDWVDIEMLDLQKPEGSIKKIYQRKNALIRPEVSNVDQALVVFAHSSPDPNLNLLDKFLIMMEKNDIPCILCFNKEDLVKEEQQRELLETYSGCGAKILSFQAGGEKMCSAKADEVPQELMELQSLLEGKLTVLAGPSGVGKSTLINLLCPEAKMETGTISRKLERGRHTTRHSELFEIFQDTYMMDTPGFTAFTLDEGFEKEDVKKYYPEFYSYEGSCKYQECSHTHEPKCKVKEAVEAKEISKVRYEGYVSIYEEIKNRRKY